MNVPDPRPSRRLVLTCLAGGATAAVCGVSSLAPVRPPADPARPRLLVLVFFDQFRGDYLTRWAGAFGDGGFRRLMADGAWFRDCHYPYAYTVTAAGHTSASTGCSPDRHGVVGNDWFDRAVGAGVDCVGTDRYERVGSGGRRGPRGASPDRLLAPTLADTLKAATRGRGRVVSLSLKDRGAVLPGGRRPDACYWFDPATGEFVTSAYYRDRPHPWVETYNRGRPADRWAGQDWARLRPDLDYVRLSGPDDGAGEGRGDGQGRTFPHPFARAGSAYYRAVFNSPFGNELLLGLAERAVEAEGLGTRDVPDLLCLSFSSNDAIGHAWGPDSQEVLDVTLRSDRVVKDLLDTLDERVGAGRYALALTADHGVCPLPETTRARGVTAARVSPAVQGAAVEAYLTGRFGAAAGPRWVEAATGPWVYLNPAAVRARRAKPADVEAALADWLRRQDGVQAAYTRTQLTAGVPAGDPVGRAVARSFHPKRCGDVAWVLKPYYLYSPPVGTGTSHGTPHPYDTHVPLLVYGPGVRTGERSDRVSPQAAAVVLAAAAGLPPPAGAEVPVPPGLFDPATR